MNGGPGTSFSHETDGFQIEHVLSSQNCSRIVACGTPDKVAAVSVSYTGQFPRRTLAGLPPEELAAFRSTS